MSDLRVLDNESLVLAITAFINPRTPSQIFALLRTEGRASLRDRFETLPPSHQEDIVRKAAEMADKGIGVLLFGDDDYPAKLGPLASSSPILFYWGNLDLLKIPGLGMCGSRRASELGLKAALACGEEVQEQGVVVVSGYAKGVDTETHLAALRGGGKTIIVLAEGFDSFRIKKTFPRELFRRENVLVLSQFAPRQPWSAGGAMTRNRLIYGLGLALVVVEAGEKGGTLAAGQGALDTGRPVFVLDFNGSTPAGNRLLLDKGGIPVSTRKRLGEEIRKLLAKARTAKQQLSLI
ncbi:DNA-processing protein DprA [Micromonospora sp. NPDC051296]|uniref:DNA-processing protein DprA n=1 Tax=Micromonospora sp. NPDC051296 TaxID=3155046 RepID=UPI003436D644